MVLRACGVDTNTGTTEYRVHMPSYFLTVGGQQIEEYKMKTPNEDRGCCGPAGMVCYSYSYRYYGAVTAAAGERNRKK